MKPIALDWEAQIGRAAYKAGLRDRMDFVEAENAFRFSNYRRADKTLVVKAKIDGTERLFADRFFTFGFAAEFFERLPNLPALLHESG